MNAELAGSEVDLSVAIPTYGREEVLLDTIDQFLVQRPRAREVLVLDQTARHERVTATRLRELDTAGRIQWIRMDRPSQPRALNVALRHAKARIVLFVDDDIRIGQDFVGRHWAAYGDPAVWAVAGQVLQLGQAVREEPPMNRGSGALADIHFPFNYGMRCFVENGMSGNLSVRRERALQVGGFDEQFYPPVSYRFDAELCKRLVRADGRILFEPSARIHHLHVRSGGTRSEGSHLTSCSAIHGVGDYYFALRQPLDLEVARYIARRPFREVMTRFHLRHAWWIPVKFLGEMRALLQAARLASRPPVCLCSRAGDSSNVE